MAGVVCLNLLQRETDRQTEGRKPSRVFQLFAAALMPATPRYHVPLNDRQLSLKEEGVTAGLLLHFRAAWSSEKPCETDPDL